MKTPASSPQIPRQLRFNESVRYKYTIGVTTMSPEEISAVWYSISEYGQMRIRERALLDRIAEETTEPSLQREEYLHTFGLETLEERAQKRTRTSEGRIRVFLEQEKQWEKGTPDVEKIATIYHSVTSDAAVAAQKRAENIEAGLVLESMRGSVRQVRDLERSQSAGSSLPKRRWLSGRNRKETQSLTKVSALPIEPMPGALSNRTKQHDAGKNTLFTLKGKSRGMKKLWTQLA